MTSRERVIAALNHEEPDRVPVDLGGTRCTGINPKTYAYAKELLAIDTPTRIIDVWQMLSLVEQPFVEKMGIDTLTVPRLVQDFGMRINEWKPWNLDDGLHVYMPSNFEPVREEDGSLCLFLNGEMVAKKVPSSPYFDRLIEFKSYDPLPPVESFEMPLISEEDLEFRKRCAETLHTETDKAILGSLGPILGRWGSYQEWMLTIALNPDYVIDYYERKIENLLKNVELYWEAVGNNIDIFWIMEDFATQMGMMISPEMFNEMVAPYYKRLYNWIHENTKWKVFYHCCGAVYPIIETLIGIGVDILNPVQTSAVGMEPEKLKDEFGDRITFWGGGIETQSVLPFGTAAEIRTQVKERIETFGSGGGFVFSPIHNVQVDVSVENLFAMFNAVKEFGRYPLGQ
ncbi:MAG: methyltransferase [Deltaproteobacteria bacterium]|nr:methyltransferase [Deltaproteobacteria bacterium]